MLNEKEPTSARKHTHLQLERDEQKSGPTRVMARLPILGRKAAKQESKPTWRTQGKLADQRSKGRGPDGLATEQAGGDNDWVDASPTVFMEACVLQNSGARLNQSTLHKCMVTATKRIVLCLQGLNQSLAWAADCK